VTPTQPYLKHELAAAQALNTISYSMLANKSAGHKQYCWQTNQQVINNIAGKQN